MSRSNNETIDLFHKTVPDSLEQQRILLRSKDRLTISRDTEVIRPRRQLDVNVTLESLDGNVPTIKDVALIDSGCTTSVIDAALVQASGFREIPLDKPIPVINADGSENRSGKVSTYVELVMTVHGHREKLPFAVTHLGSHRIYLGHDWLEYHDPKIDWREGTLQFGNCPASCHLTLQDEDNDEDPLADDNLEEGDRLFALDRENYIEDRRAILEHQLSLRTRAFQSHASKAAEQQAKSRKEQTFTDRVPEQYQDFKDIFDKDEFDKLPESRPWDHTIELTPDFKPVDAKIYPPS